MRHILRAGRQTNSCCDMGGGPKRGAGMMAARQQVHQPTSSETDADTDERKSIGNGTTSCLREFAVRSEFVPKGHRWDRCRSLSRPSTLVA